MTAEINNLTLKMLNRIQFFDLEQTRYDTLYLHNTYYTFFIVVLIVKT